MLEIGLLSYLLLAPSSPPLKNIIILKINISCETWQTSFCIQTRKWHNSEVTLRELISLLVGAENSRINSDFHLSTVKPKNEVCKAFETKTVLFFPPTLNWHRMLWYFLNRFFSFFFSCEIHCLIFCFDFFQKKSLFCMFSKSTWADSC